MADPFEIRQNTNRMKLAGMRLAAPTGGEENFAAIHAERQRQFDRAPATDAQIEGISELVNPEGLVEVGVDPALRRERMMKSIQKMGLTKSAASAFALSLIKKDRDALFAQQGDPRKGNSYEAGLQGEPFDPMIHDTDAYGKGIDDFRGNATSERIAQDDADKEMRTEAEEKILAKAFGGQMLTPEEKAALGPLNIGRLDRYEAGIKERNLKEQEQVIENEEFDILENLTDEQLANGGYTFTSRNAQGEARRRAGSFFQGQQNVRAEGAYRMAKEKFAASMAEKDEDKRRSMLKDERIAIEAALELMTSRNTSGTRNAAGTASKSTTATMARPGQEAKVGELQARLIEIAAVLGQEGEAPPAGAGATDARRARYIELTKSKNLTDEEMDEMDALEAELFPDGE